MQSKETIIILDIIWHRKHKHAFRHYVSVEDMLEGKMIGKPAR